MAHTENILNVQCFVKKDFTPYFTEAKNPKLLYVSKISPQASTHPRVMHAHEDLVELLLICSGESEYLIDDKKRHVQPGDLVIYNPKVVHDEISGTGLEVGSYCIALQGLQLPNLPENTLLPAHADPIRKTGVHFETLKELCEMMYQVLSAGQPGAEAVSHYLMLAFMEKVMVILDGNIEPVPLTDPEPHVMGRQVKEYIDAHYAEPLTLQSIADALYISTYYLSHIFKEMSGYSPMQYLLRRRIGEAQTLLITTDYSILQIAEMVGYDTQSYFNLQFTKNVGMPPKKYRMNYIVRNQKKNPRSSE